MGPKAFFILFLSFCLWLGNGLHSRISPGEIDALNVWMLDVGQGESFLIREPSGKKLLFDGGPGNSVLSEIGSLLPPWDRSIDLLVLSHNHIDHMRGFIPLLERYRVGELWISGATHTTPDFQAFMQTIARTNTPIRHMHSDLATCTQDCPTPQAFGQSIIRVYHPLRSMVDTRPKDQHDATLAISIEYGSQSLFLSGDLDEGHEKEIVRACKTPACSLKMTLLQAPHHGSATGLSEELLEAARPEAILIPVGKDNQFGHPTETVLSRIKKASLPLYRTDLHGRTHISMRTSYFSVSTALSVPP